MIQQAFGQAAAWELVLVAYPTKIIVVCCWFYVLLVYAHLTRDGFIAGNPDSTLTFVVYDTEHDK